MGRIILADENIQPYVEKLLKSESWYLGLIIGKLTGQKDHSVLLVRTPEPSEDKASDDDDEQSSSPAKRPRRRSQTKPPQLEEINEQWAATHAKQVTMMLTGGLSVIGIFALAPPAMIQAAQAKLRQVLFAIQKQEKKSQMGDNSDPIGDRILLQIDSQTRKYTCRSIDVLDPKSTFRPAEWKFQSSADTWSRLETTMALHVPLNIPNKTLRSSLARQIQNGLQPFCKEVWTSLILINGTLREENQTLNQSADKRGKSRNTSNQSTYKCNILLKHSSADGTSSPRVEECSTRLVLRGTIHGQAYVTGKASVLDAQNAMRMDLVRSVLSRCELLSDDLQMVEEDADYQEAYSTPRRVFFTLPGTTLQLCDYMFQDEKPSEVIVRVQELLHLTLNEDDLDLEQERPASEEDCVQLCSEAEDGEVDTAVDQPGAGISYYLVAGIGGALALLGAGLTFVFSQDS